MAMQELEAVRRARLRRARLGRPLLVVTISVGLVAVASFLVLPGFSPFGGRPPSTAPTVAASAPPGESSVPVVRVHDGEISMDGVPLAKTEGIDKLQRVVPLYEALVRRRVDATTRPFNRVIVSVDNTERAIVVKSVFQTASFAGYSDVAFALPDGGLLERPR